MSTISDVLAKKGGDVATIGPDATALDAANLMNERRIGALCVVEGEALVGGAVHALVVLGVGLRRPGAESEGDECGGHDEVKHARHRVSRCVTSVGGAEELSGSN